MRTLQENLQIRISVAIFFIMVVLAFGMASYLSSNLSHQVDDLRAHNSMMKSDSFDSTSRHDMSEGAGDDQSEMAMVDTTVPVVEGSSGVVMPPPVAVKGHGSMATMTHIIQNASRINKITVGLVGAGFILLSASVVLIIWGDWKAMNRQQASLVKANSNLERANRDLRTFTSKLETSNQELQEFAAVAAHDLQEPLRKVQAFGDRLKTKYTEILDDQGRDYLDRMHNASGRMAILINDLLTYSRVTSKGQPFERVDINRIAEEVVSDLEIRIEELGGRVEFEDLPTIDADPLQMRQLFQNIIGNGLKYHRSEEAPVVKISARHLSGTSLNGIQNSQSEKMCEITFEDNGIGFDEKYLDRIFGIFQRLQSRTEYEGTGIGLAVCRKIVDRHFGSITANSIPGKGSTFTVTLPFKDQNRLGASSL